VINEIENIEKRLELKKEEVMINLRSQNDALELFRLDYAGYLEFLSAVERSIDAQLDYSDMQTAFVLANIRLYRALGGGAER
jgi:outer membrane protein TolC